MKNIPNISFQKKEKNTGYEVLKLSELFSRMSDFLDHDPTQPHRLSFFALLLVTHGKGSHEVDLKKYSLQKGSMLKIAKGQVHAFQKKPEYDGYLLVFTESFIFNYFSKSSIALLSHLFNYHAVSPISINEELNQDFLSDLLLEEKRIEDYAHHNAVAALLDFYLIRQERSGSTQKKLQNSESNRYGLFVRFKNLVEEQYSKTRNVKDYAEKLHISSRYLNTIVQEFTLNTAKTFIDNYVVLEIKRTIISTDKSLKEIAFDKGFDEVTNFTKFFKKKTGLTPKAFRLN